MIVDYKLTFNKLPADSEDVDYKKLMSEVVDYFSYTAI